MRANKKLDMINKQPLSFVSLLFRRHLTRSSIIWIIIWTQAGVMGRAETETTNQMTVPKMEDISVFANYPPSRENSGKRINLEQERIFRFFVKPKISRDTLSWQGLIEKYPFTLPDKIAPSTQEELDRLQARAKADNLADPGLKYWVRAEGVIVTKQRRIYFWRLWNDRVLGLFDDVGSQCVLTLEDH